MEQDLDKLERELWGHKASYVRHENVNKNNYVVCIVVIAVILLMLVALFKIGSDESSKNGDIRENAGESALSSSVGELRVEVVVRDGVRAESESEEETRIKT